jgi:hypothetical protein
MEYLAIVIVIAVVGFIVYKSSNKGSSVSAPVPAPAPAPAPAPVEVRKAPTKAQLSKLTKKEIDNLARIEWGIQLDARETKDKMIAEFIKQAKAIIKAEQSDDGDDGEDEV